MSFLSDDEYFLFMDALKPGMIRYTDDDLKALVDVGVRTAVGFSWDWDMIEKGFGQYDWSSLDEYIESRNRAGMKVWLLWFQKGATWFPREWYVQVEKPTMTRPSDEWSVKAEGRIMVGVISPWHAEAWAYVLDSYRRVKERYSSDQVMVCNGWLTCGETVLLNELACFDPAALACLKDETGIVVPKRGDPVLERWLKAHYVRLMADIQKILVETPHREIYIALHPMIKRLYNSYGNGCDWIPEILAGYKELDPALINHVYYTWAQWPYLWGEQNQWRDQYGEAVFGGAEYCEGLGHTTPTAIAQGHRGQFIGPCDFRYGRHAAVTPWMQEQIKKSTNLWRAARP